MRNKRIHFFCLFMLFNLTLQRSIAQIGNSNNDVAVFYPSLYDSTQTQPSFAILNEPVVNSGFPSNWKLIPTFYVDGSSQNCANINCGTGVDFYGTGEVTGNLRRNNTSITLWNTDNYNYNTANGSRLYQSHPYVIGVRSDGTAFGIIADNTWEMTISITDTSILFSSQGPAFRVLTFEESTPQAVVKKLANLTGKMNMPPIWALGYHQCRYSYMSQTEVESVADSFRVNQLPCDVIWMDIDYMDQYKIFTFNSSTFPDPAGLNTFLHQNKFRSVWMIDPGVKQASGYSVYDQGSGAKAWVENNNSAPYVGTVWPGNCVFPDFTMPSTRSWWAGLYKNYMALGVDGVWNDMNEPSVFNGPGGTMPTNNIHRGGGGLPIGSHLKYHNVFGRLMVEASRNGIMQANPSKRPFVLSRSNYLGGQQFAATWTGDNYSSAAYMQLSVPMILTLGLSGQPFSGADVTGYSGTCTSDIFGHWMALGAFYPFYRNHSEKGTNRREPWTFGSAMEQVARIALQRRYRLLPYLYTLNQEATVDGMPIMRPLFFADPKDLSLRSQQQAFLLGDLLMVIPKWATGVKMPSGIWKSISLVGEDSKNDPYQPNVLLKGGSILPLGQVIQSTADFTADSLTLIVSLDSNNRANGIVYSDSGEGFGYLNAQYLIRQFNIQPLGNDSLIFTASSTSGQLSSANLKYKIGIVSDNGIAYTSWSSDSIIKIPLIFTKTDTACNSYSWNGQTYTQTGIYNYSTTNASGGDSVATLNLTISKPKITVESGIIKCNGDSTSVTVSASGGISPYAGIGTFYGYPAGTYNFVITDLKGCKISDSIKIAAPTKLSVSIQTTPVTNDSSGTATFYVLGGTPPYSLNLNTSPVQNTFTVNGLVAGTYQFTITDSNNCSFDTTVEITNNFVENNSIRIYPNPTASSVNVEYIISKPGTVLINVCNIVGKRMFSLSYYNSAAGKFFKEINLGQMGFAAGVYILKINSEGLTENKKVVLIK